ncbi:MAG TPA: amidase family protein, partial [Solirubrobacteraceae bacterium]|nr:amidase family protein [Solirubrobacteraceae bacterium]
MIALSPRRLLATVLAAVGLLVALAMMNDISSARAATLNLETLTASEAEKMLESGELTSVELVKDYIARIEAISKSGPGLNVVTQLNPNAIAEARAADKERKSKKFKALGPDAGVPILLKDIIDATPMYTSAGDWALRE